MNELKILVVPTTDWIGHPVPNRLNFIFDRLAKKHRVDVCHFKMFEDKKRATECNLIEMGCDSDDGIDTYYLRNFRRYSERIRDKSGGYDVIVSSNIIPSFTASIQDVPVIVDYLDHFPQSASSYYDRPMDKMAELTADILTSVNIRRADGIITPTESFKNHLENKTDCDIEVVPNGLDMDKITPTDPTKVFDEYDMTRPVLGYVGSLEDWIDLEDIIKMLPTVKKRYPGATLLIIGPDLHTDHSDFLKDLSKHVGVEDDVIFTGRVDYEELSPYISAMDVGLNPRKDKKMNNLTMGSKVLTYLACGVPVLSSNMPVAEKRFKGEGVHCYSNREDFLGKLAICLTEKVHPGVVKKYDWNIISKKYEDALYKFLKKYKKIRR